MTKATIHDTDDHDGQHRILLAIDLDRDDLTDPDVVDTALHKIRATLEPALRELADEYMDVDIADVCARHNVTLDDVRARRRDLQPVRARQELCSVLHHGGWSLPRIGRLIGRDHSTILHAVRQWDSREREIVRDDCEVCGDPSLGGGRWCLRHFQEHAGGREGRRAARPGRAVAARERRAS